MLTQLPPQFGDMACCCLQGRSEHFKLLLDSTLSDDFVHWYSNPGTGPPYDPQETGYYEGAEYDRIRNLCVLAAYHMVEAKQQPESDRERALSDVRKLLQTARSVDMQEQLPVLGLAQLAMAQVGGTTASVHAYVHRKYTGHNQQTYDCL